MAAPKPMSAGDCLRRAGERLMDLADRWDTPTRSLSARQTLHDDVETVAADVRAVVRGGR
jgi:hypothetical protein